MNDFARLLVRQVSADARTAPARMRAWLRAESQAGLSARAGTIRELRAAAARRVPDVVFDYVDGGAGDEVTLRRNETALQRLEFRPRVLADVSKVATSTKVLAEPVELPLISAPMGLMGLLHPAGEAAVARAMAMAGSFSILSVMASCPVEEVTQAAPGRVWFQMYLWRDRGMVRDMLARVKAAGVSVLVVTVDVPCSGNRDRDRRNGFTVPPRVTARALAEGAAHPRWSYGFVRNPRISWGNLPGEAKATAASLSSRTNQQFDPAATWADLSWFRDNWDGRLVIKGVLDPRDAREAVRRGAEAVVVSNHGGRQLDGAPATISALPAVADAVGGEAEIYLDGGIRRGADLVKALALGARACLAGRALAYGLGAAGEPGVRRAVDILHSELRTALALAGCANVNELDPSWVHSP
ncbi:MAG TPA: alpha-hydroxy acid oxidase [Streptosporangiaceae bacterium]|nr:alpha-hydroxy acid oxidase [Streptosporangiaceae bacterium]